MITKNLYQDLYQAIDFIDVIKNNEEGNYYRVIPNPKLQDEIGIAGVQGKLGDILVSLYDFAYENSITDDKLAELLRTSEWYIKVDEVL